VDHTPTCAQRDWEDRLAKPMFLLSVLFLVLLSGLLREGHHRNAGMPATMLWYYLGGVVLLWPLFLAEAVLRVFLLPGAERSVVNVGLTLVPGLLPPLRIAVRGVRRPSQMWLPGLGWQPVDYDLRKTLQLFFSVPMMFMALLILPVLAVEYYWPERIDWAPLLRTVLDVCTSAIWLAFTVEFLIRIAAAESRWQYAVAHWLDLAVVVLPTVEFMPILRVVRLTALTQLAQYYRIYGVAGKGWRAFVVLEVLQRLTHHSALARLRGELAAKENEVQELQREIDYYQRKIAQMEQRLHPPNGQATPDDAATPGRAAVDGTQPSFESSAGQLPPATS
jgi:voltage-gated potassium channel